MMRQGGETKGDTNSDEPTLPKRSLKGSGKLCYQWIYDEYVVKWYQNKLISAIIYNDIREELEALKKSKYGKKVLEADPLSQDKEKALKQLPEIEAVRQLPSSPSSEQKQSQPCKNSAGESNKTTAQGAQSSTKRFQSTKKHTDKTGSEVSTIPEQRKADKTGSQNAEVKDQRRLTEETKQKLLNETERLKADVERAECEIRQLEQKNYDLNVRLADSSTGLHDLEETHSLTRKRLLKAEERAQELTLRLSKMAGDNIRQGNPNLADLSDPYRPTELGKIFSEIYDNEWSDAYEMIHNIDENSKIKVLYDILTVSFFL